MLSLLLPGQSIGHQVQIIYISTAVVKKENYWFSFFITDCLKFTVFVIDSQPVSKWKIEEEFKA